MVHHFRADQPILDRPVMDVVVHLWGTRILPSRRWPELIRLLVPLSLFTSGRVSVLSPVGYLSQYLKSIRRILKIC